MHLFRADNRNKFVDNDKYSSTILENGDSLVVPYRYLNPKYVYFAIDSRDILKIPWTENLSYEDIIN